MGRSSSTRSSLSFLDWRWHLATLVTFILYHGLSWTASGIGLKSSVFAPGRLDLGVLRYRSEYHPPTAVQDIAPHGDLLPFPTGGRLRIALDEHAGCEMLQIHDIGNDWLRAGLSSMNTTIYVVAKTYKAKKII